MKVLILGCGRQGRVIAWDLARDRDVDKVGIIDIKQKNLEKAKSWISSDKVVTYRLDIDKNRADVKRTMEQYDVAALAVPNRLLSYRALEAMIEAKINAVSILEEYHRRPDPHETEGLKFPKGMTPDEWGEKLHKSAEGNDVVLIDGIGLEPGLTNITLGEGIRKLDEAHSAIARVGGIPSKESAVGRPLKYMVTWHFKHVLREYNIKTKVRREGRIVEVDASTEIDSFRFAKFGRDEKLECAITPGMPSFVHTRPQLREFMAKTIRWPGHWQAIQAFKECKMLNPNPVVYENKKIVPREFLEAMIWPYIQPHEGDTDVIVMWNTVTGIKNGEKTCINYYMWAETDLENVIWAMARTTSFSAAIAVRLLGKGKIKERGIIPPEDCIYGEIYSEFIKELKNRKVDIEEE